MAKIKNVVFDYGQVMIKYDPHYIVSRYIENTEDRELLERVVFDRIYHDRLDYAGITDEFAVSDIKRRLPERLHEDAEKLYYAWIYNIPPIVGMAELVTEIKEKFGVRVFLLSNISSHFVKHKDEMPQLPLFEKCIFSCEYKVVKPDRRIYEILTSECDIKAEETLFIDDSEKNIKGARDFGLSGYVFDGDVQKLREYLLGLLS